MKLHKTKQKQIQKTDWWLPEWRQAVGEMGEDGQKVEKETSSYEIN